MREPVSPAAKSGSSVALPGSLTAQPASRTLGRVEISFASTSLRDVPERKRTCNPGNDHYAQFFLAFASLPPSVPPSVHLSPSPFVPLNERRRKRSASAAFVNASAVRSNHRPAMFHPRWPARGPPRSLSPSPSHFTTLSH